MTPRSPHKSRITGIASPSKNKYQRTASPDPEPTVPGLKFNGEIVLVETLRDWSRAEDLIYRKILERAHIEQDMALGLDTETRPSFKKGEVHKVALLQLASDDLAILFRLNYLPLPPLVIHMLEDPELVKVGLAVHDDIKALKQVHDLGPQNVMDVAKMAKERGETKLGLSNLAQTFLSARINKAAKLTNWESSRLTPAQINYAATDAWATLKIYKAIKKLSESQSS